MTYRLSRIKMVEPIIKWSVLQTVYYCERVIAHDVTEIWRAQILGEPLFLEQDGPGLLPDLPEESLP